MAGLEVNSEIANIQTNQCELLEQLWREYGSRLKALPDKPEETAEAAVRALWLRAAGQQVSAQRAMAGRGPLPELNEVQVQSLRDLFHQRLSGVPLAHLTGRQNFMGLEFLASRAALIPRKETELLAQAAHALLKDRILPDNPEPNVLDLCCGSGNVSCALATMVPAAIVVGADISEEAVCLAKQNAVALSCDARVRFVAGDLFAPFDQPSYYQSFDLITCNPPYITSGKLSSMPGEIIEHEPKLAFDGGPLGMGVLWRLLSEVPRFCKPGGWLAFEVGLGQGKGLLQRLSRMPAYAESEGTMDVAGNVRTITASVKA